MLKNKPIKDPTDGFLLYLWLHEMVDFEKGTFGYILYEIYGYLFGKSTLPDVRGFT